MLLNNYLCNFSSHPLFPVLPHEMIGKETFPAAAGAEYEFVSVGHYPFFHGQIRYVEEDGLSRQPVHHADAEGRERVPVTGFSREETERLPGKRVERLFGRKVRFISRYARPIESRKVGRVMVRSTFHQCQCASHIVLHPPEFLPVFRPCDDVTMAAHGLQSVAMRLIQVFIQPLLVDLVAAAVPGKRLHVLRHLLETGKVFVTVVYEYPLVVDMVAGQHHAHGGGIAQTAVRAVCREAFVPPVRFNFTRKVIEVGKCMQAEPLVTDTHFVRIQLHVLQHARSVCRERKVPFDNTRFVLRSRNLFRGQPFQPDKPAVIDDTFKLSHRFHESLHRFLVPDFLRHQKTTAERVPVALLPGTLFGGLGEKQVAGVVQVGTFVEVAFKTAGEKAEFVPADVRLVFLRDENILFVQD